MIKGFKINIGDKLEFDYMNAEGTVGHRVAVVQNFWFGSKSNHPDPGVLIEATECESNTTKYFYAMDMTDVKQVE